MDKNKIMSPISFGNKNGVVPAIQFIKKPISYIAKQQIECGAYVKVETDDERLANASIPYGIKEEDYVLFIENLKQGKMQSVPIGKVVQENEIIRAQEKTKMPDAISNYEIIPIEKRVYIDGRGNVQLEKNDIDIRVRIKTCNGITEERMNILYTKLSNVTQIISKRFPE